MDWFPLFTNYPVLFYQGAAFPFALLFRYLCNKDSFSTRARYLFLLAGGGVLATAALGPYALLVFTPAVCAMVLLSSLGPQEVHHWTFFFQMSWQTLCHLGLHYTEYYLQKPPSVRLCITLSSLMLLTQRVTSLSMDISDGKVEAASACASNSSSCSEYVCKSLPYLSYLLFFPALLGGPLCSFRRFQAGVQGCSPHHRHHFWVLGWKALQILGLECLREALSLLVSAGPGLEECQHMECVYTMWTTAGLFKLTYYAHWLLDDTLLHAAGFGAEFGEEKSIPDADIWTLETTHRIALFTRKWNQSTAQWLRRLIFQRSKGCPLLHTFAFSAWWHGLHPGQVFGFLCWAVMVEADYVIHTFATGFVRCWPLKLLYRALTWIHTQLIIAYIMLAVEGRRLSSLWLLCNSYNSVFPVVYCILLFFLAKRKLKVN
ncbi:ghrelin O-acyltransferase [Thomomys bottae]